MNASVFLETKYNEVKSILSGAGVPVVSSVAFGEATPRNRAPNDPFFGGISIPPPNFWVSRLAFSYKSIVLCACISLFVWEEYWLVLVD